MDRKKYVVVKGKGTPFSQVEADCPPGQFCFPVAQGEDLNSVIKKICEELRKTRAQFNAKLEEITQHAQNAEFETDRDFELEGDKDGINQTFTLRNKFVPGSTRVYFNGVRLTRDEEYDYIESSDFTAVTFNQLLPEVGDIILIDYIKAKI